MLPTGNALPKSKRRERQSITRTSRNVLHANAARDRRRPCYHRLSPNLLRYTQGVLRILLLFPRRPCPVSLPRSHGSLAGARAYRVFAYAKTRVLSYMLWRGKPSPRSQVLAALLAACRCGLVCSPFVVFCVSVRFLQDSTTIL